MSIKSRRRHFRELTENTVIFFSIAKWILLSAIIGAIVGTSTAFFLKALDWGIHNAQEWQVMPWLLPLVFFLNILVVSKFSPESEGHGTEKVIRAIHKRFGKIGAAVVPIKTITTIFTISAGGSAGKEGPSAQIGAALASLFTQLFRFSDEDRKRLVICGISAGFASVFGTPIAGAIFGVEVLVAGSLFYEVLLPSFIAGMVGYQVAAFWGVELEVMNLFFVPDFSIGFFLLVVLSGIFFGIIGIIFVECLNWGKGLSQSIKVWSPFKGIFGGIGLILIALLISPDYLGLGLDIVGEALNGGNVVWYAFIVKMIATSITLNFGGSGGVVTPIFFVGATSGLLFSQLTGADPSAFAAIGLVSLLAGTANTPLSASIMAVELFGSQIAPYATLACVIAFLMTGYRSVYPSQVLGINKAPSVRAREGLEFDQKDIEIGYSARKVMAQGRKFTRGLIGKKKN